MLIEQNSIPQRMRFRVINLSLQDAGVSGPFRPKPSTGRHGNRCFLRGVVGRLWMMAIKTYSEPLRPAEPSRADNLRGALFMLAGIVFAAVDAMAVFDRHLPSLQIVWARYLGLFLGVVFLIGFRGFIIMKSCTPSSWRGVWRPRCRRHCSSSGWMRRACRCDRCDHRAAGCTILGALVLGTYRPAPLDRRGDRLSRHAGGDPPRFRDFHPGLIFP